MKSITTSYRINWPNVQPGVVGFNFQSSISPGTFIFEFKWLNGMWTGWATLPSGEVRQFGCVPDVVDWVDFPDFGIYIDSSLTFIDVNSLVGFTTLYIVVWGVD